VIALAEDVASLAFLIAAPVVLGVLFLLIGRLERDGTNPGRTPFDPPPRRRRPTKTAALNPGKMPFRRRAVARRVRRR
jgi:hypothetical protein